MYDDDVRTPFEIRTRLSSGKGHSAMARSALQKAITKFPFYFSNLLYDVVMCLSGGWPTFEFKYEYYGSITSMSAQAAQPMHIALFTQGLSLNAGGPATLRAIYPAACHISLHPPRLLILSAFYYVHTSLESASDMISIHRLIHFSIQNGCWVFISEFQIWRYTLKTNNRRMNEFDYES